MGSTRATSRRREFGNRVRNLRQERDLSQEELADKARLHRNYVGDIERGVRSVGLDSILALAQALEVSAAELFVEAPS